MSHRCPARRVMGLNAGYQMSKHAVVALTHAVRPDRLAARHPRHGACAPGFVDTNLTAHVTDVPHEQHDRSQGSRKTGRNGRSACQNTAAVAELLVNCRYEHMPVSQEKHDTPPLATPGLFRASGSAPRARSFRLRSTAKLVEACEGRLAAHRDPAASPRPCAASSSATLIAPAFCLMGRLPGLLGGSRRRPPGACPAPRRSNPAWRW